MHPCTHTYMHTCGIPAYANAFRHTHVCIDACIHPDIHTDIHTHTQEYMYAYMHTLQRHPARARSGR